jgi:hypothetical protein
MAVLVSQLTTLLYAGSTSSGDSCRPILDGTGNEIVILIHSKMNTFV